ncbi:hypothetical protein [Mesorhizobium sp. INR15]|uniref:hypothetical protein n=1 Tax=Mesorhizobium sp. INR15 TaxID=2654248 RepID=UPI0018964AC3|nr:hypothetical protein [Mesorhizobium sp. INR15]QPC90011.1 hypothetical protein GA829_05070 [Mesorhizobium sp. INR15]
MRFGKFSRPEMHKPGAAQWVSLHRFETPDASVEMSLMQVVLYPEQLPRWAMWAREFRERHAATPGIEAALAWSDELIASSGRRARSKLLVFNVQMPFALTVEAMKAYRREWGLVCEM